MEREPENKKLNEKSKLGVKRNEESQSREQNVKAQETENKGSGNKKSKLGDKGNAGRDQRTDPYHFGPLEAFIL